MADLLKTHPSHIYYHAEFSRSALTGINTGELELYCLGMGDVADPKIHTPPPHVLPRQIW